MTARFQRQGLAFEYPENWQLDEEQDSGAMVELTLFAPSGAFWSLRVEDSDADPNQLVDAAVEAIGEEYDDIDIENVQHEIEEHALVGVNLNFFCLDLSSTVKIRAMRQQGLGSVLILFQAEDRDLELLEPVFWAITTSLLRSHNV